MPPKPQSKKKISELGIMDRYSPCKFGYVPATSTKNKLDAFKSFRPKQGEVLDYNISETFLKMEHKGVQINYKETKTEFIPAPKEYIKKHQKHKHIIYSHGGPPQWKFVNEIWQEKQEELQKVYKKEFKKFLINRKKQDSRSNAAKHNLIQSLVGPEWYQELSPRQLKTVDGLAECITKDLENNSSCFTKEAIANLGLVRRPHHKKIELALKYCCNSSVEFLFILYQLLDPHRKKYSINDRLLLSSVVHLTMTETLKELHARIPSPVKDPNTVNVVGQQIPKKRNYASPYLVPYTFKPQPPKIEGLYGKKYNEIPDNFYFSYIKDFKLERNSIENYCEIDIKDLDEIGIELRKETIEAQKIYNQIHNTTEMKLLTPKVLKRCKDYEQYKARNRNLNKIELPSLPKLYNPLNECKCSSEIEKDSSDLIESANLGEKQSKHPQVSSFCENCGWGSKNINRVIIGTSIIECNEVVPIHGGIYFDINCSCREKLENELELLETQKKIAQLTRKYINNGVVITPFGPVYFWSAAIGNKRLKNLLKFRPQIKEDTRNSLQIKDPPSFDNETTKNCNCNGQLKVEQSGSFSDATTYGVCQCEQALQSFMKNQCNCENCNVERKRKEATYLLSGVIDCENEPAINIISGIQDQQCRCLHDYLEKLKRLEEYRKRCQAVYRLKKRGVKYSLGGVTVTEEGPIYQISGIRPPVNCICGETVNNIKQIEEESKRRPKMLPTGRTKYEISGVKETSKENVFIISQTLNCEECDCEKLYAQFMAEHSNCWEAYQNFLKVMETEKVEYFKECGTEAEEEMHNDDKNNTIDESAEKKRSILKSFESGLKKKGSYEYNYEKCEKPKEYDKKRYITDCEENNFCKDKEHETMNKNKEQIFDSSEKNKSEESQRDNQKCNCECARSDSFIFNPDYAIKLSADTTSEVVDAESVIPDFERNTIKVKRFAILKEIPRDIKNQRIILKEVLSGMAADGFPLAKLPDCYKLPHFRLWMQLRCGKKWTLKDRKYYENLSIFCWTHTDRCYKLMGLPLIKFEDAARTKITWNNAEYYRNLAENKKNTFYRIIKQQLIDKTREFFPTVFSYEFPTSNFRNCYFAYLPAKEENIVLDN